MIGYYKDKILYDPLNVYRGRYKEFIEGIMEERPNNEYFENSEYHHVIPKCCECKDNDEENIRLYLFPREHFLAHKLLYEENPNNKRLLYAYWRMCNGNYKVTTPEEYQEARIKFRESMIGNQINKGRKLSENQRKILFTANKTPEARKKISESLIGNQRSLGYKHSEESRKKMSESQRRALENNSDLWKQKSLQMIGNKNALGFSPSQESRKKMSEAQKRAAPHKRYHKICQKCNKEFIAKGPNKRYCAICDT